MAFGIHHDNPAPGLGSEFGEQQLVHEKRGEMVHRPDGFEALVGLAPGRQVEPGIVDKHVDVPIESQKGSTDLPGLGQAAEIRNKEIAAGSISSADFSSQLFGFLPAPINAQQVGAHGRVFMSRVIPDAGGGAGDHRQMTFGPCRGYYRIELAVFYHRHDVF
jgi:hypothetical protein